MISARDIRLIERLQLLGLTVSEAKAYVAVVRLGLCRVTEIAREAHVQRPEVYHIMPRLLSLGLIEETLDRPQRYRASKIQSGIGALIESAMSRHKEIAERTKDLASQIETIQRQPLAEVEEEIRVITGIENIRRNFHEMINSAQTEIWMIATRVPYISRTDTKRMLGEIEAKGIKARAILNVNEDNINHVRRVASRIQVRHYEPLFVHLYGVDDRSVAVGLEAIAQTDPERMSELYTNYPSYVKTIGAFFETTWDRAIPLDSRLAMLEGRPRHAEHTRIIWGREAISQETFDWDLRAKKGIIRITTNNGPVRLWARLEKGFTEAREGKPRWRILCHITPENSAAVKKLSEIADVRLVDRPFGIGIVVLDDSEAMIHYIDPDSADLRDSSTDLALVTTDRSVAQNILRMLNSIWKHAKPLKIRTRH